MKLSMTVMLFALVLAPAATEAESEKKIELMLDMSIAEVKKLKGKPITRVNLGDTIIRKGLGNTTVLSYDDVKLVFGDDKLAGKLGLLSAPLLYGPLRTEEEEVMRIMGTPREEFKKTYPIPSMRFGRAEPETIELTVGMSIAEVKKLKGKPNNTFEATISGEIRISEYSAPTGQFLSYKYDDITLVFWNGKLFNAF